jgi:ABC-type phosphate transport system substrate-binding protein
VKSQMTSALQGRSGQSARPRKWKRAAFVGLASLCALLVVGPLAGVAAAAGGAPSDGSGDSTTTSSTTTTTTTWPTASATPPAAPAERSFVTAASIAGNGSSFASPAVTNWADEVGQSPYNISVSYTPSSSGQGRYEFTNGTVDYAVSDTGYVNSSVGTTPPSFPFEFIPITAAGVAFMYNVPGLTSALQLTSYTACLLLTGQIKNWDDPALKQNGANASVTLPNLPVLPITESDPAGTNFVLEEYCIDEQPAVWAQYAKNMAALGAPPSGVPISATTPGSNWEAPGNGYDEQSTSAVASNIVNNAGAIGVVQVNYANDSGFTGSNPAHAVAEVENASGKYTLPTPVDVASALAYATQLSNGTHQLNFNGIGPNVYNPSTYSYLLTPTKGWSSAKGDTMSQFVNYVLTLGQQVAPKFGYASLGLSLERYGIDQVIANVPGAVDPTAAESQAYACGDLTPTEVQAGQTTPTCGVTNGTPPPPPPGATNVTLVNGNTAAGKATASAEAAGSKSGAGGSGAGESGAGGGEGGADPSVALTGTSSMAQTGSDPLPLIGIGVLLLAVGWIGRRVQIRRRTRGSS